MQKFIKKNKKKYFQVFYRQLSKISLSRDKKKLTENLKFKSKTKSSLAI